jgi:hypothetical protein
VEDWFANLPIFQSSALPLLLTYELENLFRLAQRLGAHLDQELL